MANSNELPEWALMQEDVYFGADFRICGFPCPKRQEEYLRMRKQVRESKGFDIDFTQFTYRFNYIPLDFDDNDYAVEPETTRELVDRLTRKSLEGYNENMGTKYELVEIIKGNCHGASAGYMFYITFQGKDPCDDEPKHFRAKFCYLYFNPPLFISCDLKPEKKVHSIETTEKEDVKKPKLTEEPSGDN